MAVPNGSSLVFMWNDNPFAEFTPEAMAAKKEKQEKEDYEEAKKREKEFIDEKIKEVSRD